MSDTQAKPLPKCSFCGKNQDQVRKLIAAPGVLICDECVELCQEILDEEVRPQPWPFDRTGHDVNFFTLPEGVGNRFTRPVFEMLTRHYGRLPTVEDVEHLIATAERKKTSGSAPMI